MVTERDTSQYERRTPAAEAQSTSPTQRVFFRLVQATELERVREYYRAKYPWASEPDWATTWVRWQDGEISGLLAVRLRPIVQVLDADSPVNGLAMIERADAYLAGMGINAYEFIVPDANERMQRALERHYGLAGQVEVPHRVYLVTRGQ